MSLGPLCSYSSWSQTVREREDHSFQGGAGDVCSPCTPWFCPGSLEGWWGGSWSCCACPSLSWGWGFFFFCVRCDDRAKSSGRWLLGSPPSAVVRQLAPRAWCPLQCLLAKTVGVLSPGVGRSEECAQGFGPQSHIHSGLNQQDLVSLDVFLAHSDQYADGRWWFGSSCQGC